MSAGRQGFGFIITLILAALLGPTAYGTVAMAYVFVSFTQIFLVQGLMPALIQRRDLTSRHLSSIFWFALMISACLSLVCVAASGWWASVNRLPDLQPVIIALSLLLPVSGLMVVQEAWLRRHLQFKKLAVRENGSIVAGGAVGIISAILGAGVWALVLQQLTTQLVAVIVLWGISDWRPTRHMAWSEFRELLPFTSASSLSAVGSFVNNQGDALIIGLFFGPQVVGLYRFASRVVIVVVEVLARSLQAVSLPELARLQHDAEAVRARLASLLAMAARSAIPLLALIAAMSPWFVPLLGSEWSPATTALMLLCAAGVMRVFATFSGPLLQALNRPGLLAALVWFSAGLSALLFIGAGVLLEGQSVSRQVNGMALTSVALFVVLIIVNSWILRRYGGISPRDQVRVVLLPLLAGAAILAVAALCWFSGVTEGLGPVAALALASFVSGGTGAVVLLTLDKPSREMVNGVRKAVGSRRTAPTDG